MKRHIKFPLFLKDNIPVRTLEDLHRYFDMEKMLSYYAEGKLAVWLRDRYYDELAAQVQALQATDPELVQKLCELLGIRHDAYKHIRLKDIRQRNEKIARIKKITDKTEILDHPEAVAFTQSELDSILQDAAIPVVYLYGEHFKLKDLHHKKQFVGINQPKLELSAQVYVTCIRLQAEFENIQRIMEHAEAFPSASEYDEIAKSLKKMNIEHPEHIAFTQKEFETLLRKKTPTIYLVGETYKAIPIDYTVRVFGITQIALTFSDCPKMYYRYLAKDNVTKANTFQVGDIVIMGKYHNQPLEWIVLSNNENSDLCLLLCKNVIASTTYLHFLYWKFPEDTFSETENKLNPSIKFLNDVEYMEYAKIVNQYPPTQRIWLANYGRRHYGANYYKTLHGMVSPVHERTIVIGGRSAPYRNDQLIYDSSVPFVDAEEKTILGVRPAIYIRKPR